MPSRPRDLELDIDALYQRPLGEFTAARNALAAGAGAEGASIRKLAKPHLPAWAINQLYWRKRPLFDRLLKATQRLRAVHVRAISGRPADLQDAEAAHGEALRAAEAAAREFLKDAGEVESPATLTAIAETLQAVLAIEEPGRLVQPLKPLGFEALAGMLKPGAAPPLTLVKGRAAGGAATRAAAVPAARQASAADARRKIEAAKRALATAKEDERTASAALARARHALASSESHRAKLLETRDKLSQTIEEQAGEIHKAAAVVREHEQAAARASEERARRDGDLESARKS